MWLRFFFVLFTLSFAGQTFAKKDEFGFFHDQTVAIREAKLNQKPLLIGFFAIWCPPCNLYHEQVFPTQAFKDATSPFVLLKVDADDPSSFELKSHFKAGGYPTILIATASTDRVSDLHEISRVVGFRTAPQLATFLQNSLTTQSHLLAAKSALQRLIGSDNETEALMLAIQASVIYDGELYFALQQARSEAIFDPTILRSDNYASIVRSLLANPHAQSSEVLLLLHELLVTHAEMYRMSTLEKLSAVYDELEAREDPLTHAIPGVDVSNADLDLKRIAWAGAMKDDARQKQMYTRGITRLKKLLAIMNASDSRAVNIELAAMLRDSGAFNDGRAIYDRMIKEYPTDFTFYFAAAKLMLKANDPKAAKIYNDNALKYAYGDNLIRATELEVKILTALGENQKAKAFGQEFLRSHPPTTLDVRTNRYLKDVEKAIAKAGSSK